MYTVTKLADTIYTLSADDLDAVACTAARASSLSMTPSTRLHLRRWRAEAHRPGRPRRGAEPADEAEEAEAGADEGEAAAEQAAFEQAAAAAVAAGEESFP